jgi:hypothetical protein
MFAEQWFAGTYLVSGTFFLKGDGVTPGQIIAQVDLLYREIRRHKRAKWPRGLAGFFVIPVFCSTSFSPEVSIWVRTRHPYKWAIWLEPLLYDSCANTVLLREDYQLFGRAFFPYLNQLFTAGLSRAAAHFGHSNPNRACGSAPTSGNQ